MSQIKILCIGDPHFKSSNKPETDEMVKSIIKFAKETNPDYIVNLGDTLDRFAILNQFPLKHATDFLKELAKIAKTFVLIGNHDRPSQEDFMGPYHPFVGMEEIPNLTIVHETIVVRDSTLNGLFVFCPYVPPGKFNDALFYQDRLKKEDLSNVVCVFAHQEIRGCEYNGRLSKNGDVWDKTMPMLVCGHIHNYHKLNNNVLYPGTPMQHDFGDLVTKSLSLLTFDAKNGNSSFPHPIEKRLFLGLKERKVINMSASDAEKWKHDPTYLWKIRLVDTAENINLFYLGRRYKKLAELGVMFSQDVVQTSKNGKKDGSEIKNINAANYQKLIWKKIQNNKREEKWLDIILKS